MSTFSLAIGNSLLEVEPQGLRLDGLELHLVPVVHTRLLARYPEHALEPDEAPVQLPQLRVRALREQLAELPLADDVAHPLVLSRDHPRPVTIEGRLLLRRPLLGLAHRSRARWRRE